MFNINNISLNTWVIICFMTFGHGFAVDSVEQDNQQQEIKQEQATNTARRKKSSLFKRDIAVVGTLVALYIANTYVGLVPSHCNFVEEISQEIITVKAHRFAMDRFNHQMEVHQDTLFQNDQSTRDRRELEEFLEKNKPTAGRHDCAICWDSKEDVVFFPCECVMIKKDVICKSCFDTYRATEHAACPYACGRMYKVVISEPPARPVFLAQKSTLAFRIAQFLAS